MKYFASYNQNIWLKHENVKSSIAVDNKTTFSDVFEISDLILLKYSKIRRKRQKYKTKTKQKTKQNKTKQNKTKQNKTKKTSKQTNKTKQNKKQKKKEKEKRKKIIKIRIVNWQSCRFL